MRVAIIGAGPAGMTAALELARGGAEVSVYEASEQVGGMSRTFELWGQRVDLGPHRFFSTDRRVNQLWLDVVGNDYAMVDRQTRIYYQGQFYPYPLKPLATLRNLGVTDAAACLTSYVKEQFSPSFTAADLPSFESWVVLRFGRRLFETFFKSYTEKLWGIPCGELSPDFAAQRIKAFSLREALLSAISPQRGKRHETLLDRFAYPLAGTGVVYQRMAEQVRQLDGEIHLRRPVQRILHEGCEVYGLQFPDGEVAAFDHVISTMPLSLLVRGMNDVPTTVTADVDQLQFRNTILVYLQVDSDSLFDDQWLYIHDPNLKIGRLTNFRNWTSQLYDGQQTTILAAELWCNDDDPEWQASEASLIELATNEIRSTGLLKNEAVLAGRVVRVPRCYPVYRQGYRRQLDTIAGFLRNFRSLTPIGRYGAFKYGNQDHSILMGILAAEKILGNCDHDLWKVNANDERYQEASLISETGLGSD